MRRRFIDILLAAFWITLIAPIPGPIFAAVDVRAGNNGSISFLNWDTEADAAPAKNLLRAGTSITAQIKVGDLWNPAGADISLIAEKVEAGFDLTAKGATGAVRLRFPFDPRASAVTVLPARVDDAAGFHLPAVISAPGFGQMLVTGPAGIDVVSTLEGSRDSKIIDWIIDLPAPSADGPVALHFRPLLLAPPKGLKDETRWKLARRGWFNMFQLTAKWGDAGNPFSAPSGMLGNNVISDPVSCCLFVYADAALWTPEVAPGVSVIGLVGHTLDWWLNKRMLPTGEVPGYWNLNDFLDANPSLLISAWDYVEATGDREWLSKRIDRLERAAEFVAERDPDGDGLFKAVQSGNPYTLKQPARSCSAYDAINCGHIDGYCNALIYRAFRCMADLESNLNRGERQKRYTILADRLKAAYAKALLNPATGWLGWWRSRDGALHDYDSPLVNGLAVDYGLIDPAQGREILKRLREQMRVAGFNRFDLGIPMTLLPVRRADYLQIDGFGCPKQEDGSDTFGHYLNGGVVPGDTLRFLAGCYTVGEDKAADDILDAMLDRVGKGDFPAGFATSIVNEYPRGAEFFTWKGESCGYEGLLSHAYHFLQAVVIREPSFRDRLHRPWANAPGAAR